MLRIGPVVLALSPNNLLQLWCGSRQTIMSLCSLYTQSRLLWHCREKLDFLRINLLQATSLRYLPPLYVASPPPSSVEILLCRRSVGLHSEDVFVRHGGFPGSPSRCALQPVLTAVGQRAVRVSTFNSTGASTSARATVTDPVPRWW
ncbi:hypothetical protein BC834DRAFT_861788 [Gloeopeniophorella convolvens]|nr:hypothetical protein BC834DRAFT_861788 [Gloeopeniophorella convolvens]